MSRNASARGVLLGSPSRFDIGERLVMTFRIMPAGPMYAGVAGKVVRVDEAANAEDPMWRHVMAIEFERPLDEEVIEALRTAAEHTVYLDFDN